VISANDNEDDAFHRRFGTKQQVHSTAKVMSIDMGINSFRTNLAVKPTTVLTTKR